MSYVDTKFCITPGRSRSQAGWILRTISARARDTRHHVERRDAAPPGRGGGGVRAAPACWVIASCSAFPARLKTFAAAPQSKRLNPKGPNTAADTRDARPVP